MRLRHALAAGLAASAACLLPGAAGAADRTVLMDGGEFVPPMVEITVGDTVTWTNRDALLHDASGDGWATELLLDDQSGSVTFTTAGSFDYICTIHQSMTGTVVVTAGTTGSTPTPPPADGEAVVSAPARSAMAIYGVLAAAGCALLIGLQRFRASR